MFCKNTRKFKLERSFKVPPKKPIFSHLAGLRQKSFFREKSGRTPNLNYKKDISLLA